MSGLEAEIPGRDLPGSVQKVIHRAGDAGDEACRNEEREQQAEGQGQSQVAIGGGDPGHYLAGALLHLGRR